MSSLDDIEERLQSPKWNIRLKAVRELVKEEDKEKAAELLVKMMHDRRTLVREQAASILLVLVSDEKSDLSRSIKGLSFFVGRYFMETHADRIMKRKAVSILRAAARNGTDISEMVDGLVECLEDFDEGITGDALRALGMAAANKKGQDRTISRLIENCENAEFDMIEENIIRALGIAAERGDRQTREKVVSAVIEIINSDWFREEAEDNSDIYLDMMEELGILMKKIEKRESEGKLSEGTVKPPKREPEAKKAPTRRIRS